MNKGITILILLVVLGAMGLVFYSHTRQSSNGAGETAREGTPQPASPASGGQLSGGTASGGQTSGVSSPLQAPQDGNGKLKQIEPPLTNAHSGADGAPAPVRVIAGNSGVPAPTLPTPPAATPPAATPPAATPPAASSTSPTTPAPAISSSSAIAPIVSGPDAAPRGAVNRPSSGSPELTPWGTPSSGTPPSTGAEATRPATQTSGVKTPATNDAKPQAGDAKPQATDAKPSPGDAKPQGRDEGKTSAVSVPPAKEPSLSDKDPHTLRDIGLHFAGQDMQLRIEADSAFPCRTFVLNNPDRLVIDLPGSWKGVKAPVVPQNRLIKTIRVGSQPTGPRIVLDLAGAPKGHKVQRNGNVVEILVQ